MDILDQIHRKRATPKPSATFRAQMPSGTEHVHCIFGGFRGLGSAFRVWDLLELQPPTGPKQTPHQADFLWADAQDTENFGL